MKNVGTQTGIIEASFTKWVQEIEGRNSTIEDMIEEMDISVKQNVKSKNFLTQNIQEIWELRRDQT